MIRDHLQEIIRETYQEAGFERITTPIIEDAVNLDKSEGGENLNLIFKILKRGKKLSSALEAEAPTEQTLADMGLRYDLTLPLSRYYANNRNDAEVELILTTTKALTRIGLSSFKVKINDRRILKAIFTYAGFAEEDHEKLAIIFDKLDKIGIEGVQKELEENAFDASAIEKFIALFESGALDLDSVAKVCDADYVASLKYIMDTVTSVSGNAFPISCVVRAITPERSLK